MSCTLTFAETPCLAPLLLRKSDAVHPYFCGNPMHSTLTFELRETPRRLPLLLKRGTEMPISLGRTPRLAFVSARSFFRNDPQEASCTSNAESDLARRRNQKGVVPALWVWTGDAPLWFLIRRRACHSLAGSLVM